MTEKLAGNRSLGQAVIVTPFKSVELPLVVLEDVKQANLVATLCHLWLIKQ